MLSNRCDVSRRLLNAGLRCCAGVLIVHCMLAPSGCSKAPPPPGVQGALLPTLSLGTAAAPVVAPLISTVDVPSEARTYDVTAAVLTGVRINSLTEAESADAVRAQIEEQVAQLQLQSVEQARMSTTWKPAVLRTEGERHIVDVTAHSEAHRSVASLLETMAQSGFGQISIEVRFMASPKEYLGGQVQWKSLSGTPSAVPPANLDATADGVSGKVTIDESLPVLSAVIGPMMTGALVREHQQDPHGNILFGPKVTLRNGFTGTLTSEVARPFVTGVEIASDQRSPEIQLLTDGTRLRMRPVFAADHQSIRITGTFEISEILEVTTATTATAGGPISVQVPRVRRSTIQFADNLQIGESLVVQCLPTSDGDRKGYRHLLITPVPIPLSDAKW